MYGNALDVLYVRLKGLNTTYLQKKEKKKRKKVQRNWQSCAWLLYQGAEVISGPEHFNQKTEMNKTSDISLKYYDMIITVLMFI